MGRRALRRVDPELDLSRNFKMLEELAKPLDERALFGRKAPLEVEVGSGKGLFLDTASQQRPDHNFLGIEIARKYARFAAARMAKHQRGNAVMICGDAMRLFQEHLAAESVSAVHVYFPDPWWKKRHHKRRIMNEQFLAEVERVLPAGGSLHFWTDVEDYYWLSLELIAQKTSLSPPITPPERPAEHHLDYRTHFERRTRLEERPVYRAEFKRR